MSLPTIRVMRRGERDLASVWATAEGWNPGLPDTARLEAVDPEGFLVGEAVGEPVGRSCAVRYPCGVGFIGFCIMRPARHGIGHRIAQ